MAQNLGRTVGRVLVGLALAGWAGATAAEPARTSHQVADLEAPAEILIDRWGRMGTPLETTTWQLIFGGAMLLPVALMVEGLPPAPGLTEALGYGWLMLLGTAFAYYVWTRGIGKIGPSAIYLALASPVVATAVSAMALGEWFNPLQWAGMALVIGSTAVGVSIGRRR